MNTLTLLEELAPAITVTAIRKFSRNSLIRRRNWPIQEEWFTTTNLHHWKRSCTNFSATISQCSWTAVWNQAKLPSSMHEDGVTMWRKCQKTKLRLCFRLETFGAEQLQPVEVQMTHWGTKNSGRLAGWDFLLWNTIMLRLWKKSLCQIQTLLRISLSRFRVKEES